MRNRWLCGPAPCGRRPLGWSDDSNIGVMTRGLAREGGALKVFKTEGRLTDCARRWLYLGPWWGRTHPLGHPWSAVCSQCPSPP